MKQAHSRPSMTATALALAVSTLTAAVSYAVEQPTTVTPPAKKLAPKTAVEPIPDDIWDTIASPFDPISTPPGYAPPQQRVETMQPRRTLPAPLPAAEPQLQPAPAAPTQPTINRYPVTPPIPYELPPPERVVLDYPEEYWNCLLNNLQGVGSDVAAKLITRACQKKHPKQ